MGPRAFPIARQALSEVARVRATGAGTGELLLGGEFPSSWLAFYASMRELMSIGRAANFTNDLSGRRLGRYEVLSQLAQGGMATVYVARAQGVAGFERLMAIKVLHPHLAHDEEFISMFLDEARLAASIHHPNVVPTLDISDSNGDGFFLVMEYIQGDHFGSLLREASKHGARIPVPVALRIAADALEGLNAAHQLEGSDGKKVGLVHRDVSPHNILVGSDGAARLTDFGVAKAEVRLSSTRDGLLKGKLAYMAPEQASTGQVDQRSDLFSMAVVLWEALTGRRLFKADSNGELLRKLLYDPLPLASMYEPELEALDALLTKGLARKPEMRFQSAGEFVEAIETASHAFGGMATPRQVARTVRTWLGPKIDAEAGRVQAAIDAFGASDIRSHANLKPVESSSGQHMSPSTMSASNPAPPNVYGENSSPSLTPSAVRVMTAEDATMGARPHSMRIANAAQAEKSASKKMLVALALCGAIGAAVWWVYAKNSDHAAQLRGTDAPATAANRPQETPGHLSAPAATNSTEQAQPNLILPGATELEAAAANAEIAIEINPAAVPGPAATGVQPAVEPSDLRGSRPRLRGGAAEAAQPSAAGSAAAAPAPQPASGQPQPEAVTGSTQPDDLIPNPYHRN